MPGSEPERSGNHSSAHSAWSVLARALRKLKEGSLNQAIPGLELLKILSMDGFPDLPSEVQERELFGAEIGGVELLILRLSVRLPEKLRNPAPGLWIVANEIVPCRPPGSGAVGMDFLFDAEAHLLGIFPVPDPLGPGRDRASRSGPSQSTERHGACREPEIGYFDLTELWMDIRRIQPGDPGAPDSYAGWAARRSLYSRSVEGYLHELLGAGSCAIAPCGRVSYVYESEAHGGPYVRQMSFGDLGLLLSRNDSRFSAAGNVFIVLPTTYVPGRSVDIGYHDAIRGPELGLCQEDVVFVMGFGSGLDLISAARRASFAYGMEVNPFSVASGRTNLAVAGLEHKAMLDWGDLRDLAEGSPCIPRHLCGRITKVIWNMAYESSRARPVDPVLMGDFHDGYAVLDWFVPFLARTKILAPRWKALLWNIVSEPQELVRRFQDFGLQAEASRESDTFIVSPARVS